MNKQKYKITNHFVFGMISVFGAMHMAIGPNNTAQAQNDVSDGQISVKSPNGTIEMTIRYNRPLTYAVFVDGKAPDCARLSQVRWK